jgi:hypothetical protein
LQDPSGEFALDLGDLLLPRRLQPGHCSGGEGCCCQKADRQRGQAGVDGQQKDYLEGGADAGEDAQRQRVSHQAPKIVESDRALGEIADGVVAEKAGGETQEAVPNGREQSRSDFHLQAEEGDLSGHDEGGRCQGGGYQYGGGDVELIPVPGGDDMVDQEAGGDWREQG